MKPVFLIFFQFIFLFAQAQIKISGTVVSKPEKPVSGVNLFLQGTYDGTTSDSLGQFEFRTDATGEQTLIASCIGFETKAISLTLSSNISNLKIVMVEEINELNEVTINAGTFEASDKKKSVILKPLDIALTAGANGDIFGAFGTLPGSHRVGEDGRLFVRGGESYETKTFMDGMLINTPYFSKMPDLPTRGRFSPLLFNGSVFSTGGYSAEFGQALSSIVSLNTTALEPEDSGFSCQTLEKHLPGTYRRIPAHRFQQPDYQTKHRLVKRPGYCRFNPHVPAQNQRNRHDKNLRKFQLRCKQFAAQQFSAIDPTGNQPGQQIRLHKYHLDRNAERKLAVSNRSGY